MPSDGRFTEPEYTRPSFGQLLFSAQGRISRSQFWIRSLFLGLGIFFLIIIFPFAALARTTTIYVVLYIFTAFFWLVQWPIIIIMIKRIHDRNKSGWTVLIYYVPSTLDAIVNFVWGRENPAAVTLSLISLVIGIWFLVELGCMRGTMGDNRFGPDPVV